MEENKKEQDVVKEETTQVKKENIKTKENTTENKKDLKNDKPKKKSKVRMVLVLIFIALFVLAGYVILRGSYLEYMELGANYIDVFNTNLQYKVTIFLVNFVVLFLLMLFVNKGIKKGLTQFFEKEKKTMPKLPNKSLSLVISTIVSVVVAMAFTQKIILVMSNSYFGITDPIFNFDIAYYIFQKPVIEMFIVYLMALIVGLTIYRALYYVIVFNKYFDGIDGKMLKESRLIKDAKRNVIFLSILIALITIIGTQNILFGNIVNIGEDEIGITGAGYTEATINLWGYIIFAVLIVICINKAIKNFINGKSRKGIKYLVIIPAYLVLLFIVMIVFDLIFVNSNELDKEKTYLQYNIENTKNAYNINIDESNITDSGTITEEEIDQNPETIKNIPVVSTDMALKTLSDTQTNTGYYSYSNINIAKYLVNGKQQLVLMSPREVTNTGRTYNNKTYEYTHGMGLIVASATNTTDTGTLKYLQKDIAVSSDNILNITQPRIYFGLQTNETVATNTKNKQEYDYTDENGTDKTSTYDGNAGLSLGFIDRLILGITKGDLALAFSGELTDDSKILINRDIIDRAKKALPNLIYDENPYTVVTDDGKIVWVLDAYTVSSNYPYSQYTSIEHDNVKEKINYIRNSIKVIIDSYDGTMKFYVTDRTDPIAMSYRNSYETLFEDIDTQIPEDISKHFVYPEYLYKIQANMLNVYHNVKPDVLYRADDLWSIAKTNTTSTSNSTGTAMQPYYTMVKTYDDNADLGLMQIYTPYKKQNLIGYLVGKTDGSTNKLKLYKFSQDSNLVGPMQLDKQIQEDEAIAKEIESISTTGTKITKNMMMVPIDNTILYVESVYQTMLNESEVPALKKVIVASGNKVAIGDNLEKALANLLSQYAVDIEVENTEDIQGLIDAIIKANNNLTESNNSNNWEMMGKDVQKLQDLIKTLEELQKEEAKKQAENNTSNNTTNNTLNNQTVNTNVAE